MQVFAQTSDAVASLSMSYHGMTGWTGREVTCRRQNPWWESFSLAKVGSPKMYRVSARPGPVSLLGPRLQTPEEEKGRI